MRMFFFRFLRLVEVIQTTDPKTAQAMFNAVNEVDPNLAASTNPQQQVHNTQSNGTPAGMSGSGNSSGNSARRSSAYVRITEQPASKALRFRYECEGRSAGSIPGVYSTPENKTFPSIQIVGYKGRAVVVVSCVTKDPPYR